MATITTEGEPEFKRVTLNKSISFIQQNKKLIRKMEDPTKEFLQFLNDYLNNENTNISIDQEIRILTDLVKTSEANALFVVDNIKVATITDRYGAPIVFDAILKYESAALKAIENPTISKLKNDNGWTAVHQAVIHHKSAAFEVIKNLELGAITDNKGWPAFATAVLFWRPVAEYFLEHQDLARDFPEEQKLIIHKMAEKWLNRDFNIHQE